MTSDAKRTTMEHTCSMILQHSLVAQRLKRLPAMWEIWVRSLGWEDPLEKEMATHSSTFTWKIPWTEEPDRLQSMGVTIESDKTERLHLPSFIVHGAAKSWTGLSNFRFTSHLFKNLQCSNCSGFCCCCCS